MAHGVGQRSGSRQHTKRPLAPPRLRSTALLRQPGRDPRCTAPGPVGVVIVATPAVKATPGPEAHHSRDETAVGPALLRPTLNHSGHQRSMRHTGRSGTGQPARNARHACAAAPSRRVR